MFSKAGSHWSKRETLVEHMVRIGHSADFKTQKAQIRSYSTFCCLNYPEKYRYRVLCSEYVGILQPHEMRTLWPAKCVANVYGL
jgi:hypothetical protein